MVNRDKIYKCSVCGNLVEKLVDINMNMICCGKEMIEQVAKKEDSTTEKHVPFVEEIENGIRVKIGENEKHPMTEEHYIIFIEVITNDDKVLRQYLTPTSEPEAEFVGIEKDDVKVAREYCNLHGLWEN